MDYPSGWTPGYLMQSQDQHITDGCFVDGLPLLLLMPRKDIDGSLNDGAEPEPVSDHSNPPGLPVDRNVLL